MKKSFLTMMAVVVLVLALSGCSKEDNPVTPSVPTDELTPLEQSLVGLWYDEYEYADVTEDGVPFSRVLLAVLRWGQDIL